MSREPSERSELSNEELAGQEGESLPDREVMSIVNPGGEIVPPAEALDPNPALPEPPQPQ